MKTNELSGAQLDYAVARAEGRFDELDFEAIPPQFRGNISYSTDWALSGSIIEREGIALYLYSDSEWNAHVGGKESVGLTPLIAAMRCYVASKLGDEIEIPKEITNEGTV
jgi:hypothetical protein